MLDHIFTVLVGWNFISLFWLPFAEVEFSLCVSSEKDLTSVCLIDPNYLSRGDCFMSVDDDVLSILIERADWQTRAFIMLAFFNIFLIQSLNQ